MRACPYKPAHAGLPTNRRKLVLKKQERKFLLSLLFIFLSPLLVSASNQPFAGGAFTPVDDRINVAAAANGGTATASSTLDNYSPDALIDGDRKGLNLTSGTSWATIPGTAVTNNNHVWRSFSFPQISTDKI